jgi:dTDP-4-amino-4,6-dideoxygalactose transaminase
MIIFNDTASQWKEIRKNCLLEIDELLSSESELILGETVEEFEKKFASWNKNKYGIGVSNGTDAIKIALKSLNSNGVIIQANTWMSTLTAVIDAGQRFSIVDCDEYHQMNMVLLEQELSKGLFDTVIVAHMFGHSCDMKQMMTLKERYKFKLLEDCSQSCGTLCFEGKKTGTFGDAAVFSLHPRKNLGACGDAGAILSNNPIIYQKCKLLRNLGSSGKNKHAIFGWNNRLDSIQAIILLHKIPYIEKWNSRKIEISKTYSKEIKNDEIETPKTAEYCELNSHYAYPLIVKKRDEFLSHMQSCGISTRTQYSTSIEKLKCFEYLNIPKTSTITNYIFEHTCSIPLHAFLKSEEINHIISSINKFKD